MVFNNVDFLSRLFLTFICAGVKISVEQPRGLRAVLKSVYNSPPLNDLTFYQPPDQDKYGHCTLQVRRFAKSHSVKNADGILSLMLLAGFLVPTPDLRPVLFPRCCARTEALRPHRLEQLLRLQPNRPRYLTATVQRNDAQTPRSVSTKLRTAITHFPLVSRCTATFIVKSH